MIKRLLRWIRTSMEGDDGRPSHRKLTTFAFVALVVYLVIKKEGIRNQLELNAFYALLISIGVLIGIITVADITKFMGRGGRDKDEEKTVVEPAPIKQGDEITATITDIKTQENGTQTP